MFCLGTDIMTITISDYVLSNGALIG